MVSNAAGPSMVLDRTMFYSYLATTWLDQAQRKILRNFLRQVRKGETEREKEKAKNEDRGWQGRRLGKAAAGKVSQLWSQYRGKVVSNQERLTVDTRKQTRLYLSDLEPCQAVKKYTGMPHFNWKETHWDCNSFFSRHCTGVGGNHIWRRLGKMKHIKGQKGTVMSAPMFYLQPVRRAP